MDGESIKRMIAIDHRCHFSYCAARPSSPEKKSVGKTEQHAGWSPPLHQHRDTETQRHRDTETQRHRNTETQRHRDAETQKDKHTKARESNGER